MRDSIVVDEFQVTSDPNIYAVGDAVETADRVLGGRLNVPLGKSALFFLGPSSRPQLSLNQADLLIDKVVWLLITFSRPSRPNLTQVLLGRPLFACLMQLVASLDGPRRISSACSLTCLSRL